MLAVGAVVAGLWFGKGEPDAEVPARGRTQGTREVDGGHKPAGLVVVRHAELRWRGVVSVRADIEGRIGPLRLTPRNHRGMRGRSKEKGGGDGEHHLADCSHCRPPSAASGARSRKRVSQASPGCSIKRWHGGGSDVWAAYLCCRVRGM